MKKKNYYNEIIIQIKNLINDKNYKDAYLKCNNELEMPYIPKKIELELIELFKKINIFYNNKNNNFNKNKIIKWNLEEIKKILLNPFDEEIHFVAFQYLKNFNVRLIMNILKKYLINSLYSNQNKTYLLFVLKEQNINEILKVKKTNGIFNINPIEIIDFYHNINIKKILKLLDYYIYNNPSLYNISLCILQNYFYCLFPYLLEFDNEINDLVAAIIYKANLLQLNNIKKNNISNLFGLYFNLKNMNKYFNIFKKEKIF